MYTAREQVFPVLVEAIKLAIQKYKDERVSVDYETCIRNYCRNDMLNKWFSDIITEWFRDKDSQDYETCVRNYFRNDILNEWFWDKGSQAVILKVCVFGTYREAIIQIDGYRFNLERLFKKIMNGKKPNINTYFMRDEDIIYRT